MRLLVLGLAAIVVTLRGILRGGDVVGKAEYHFVAVEQRRQ